MDHLLEVRVQLMSLRPNKLSKPIRYVFRSEGKVKADCVSRCAEQFRAIAAFFEELEYLCWIEREGQINVVA
ncbi:hypothetical protein D3C76_1748260 [compost metagenome]